MAQSSVTIYDYHPQLASFQDQVIRGLQSNPKEIPCKFFYDSRGLALFHQICQLPEYYPTRTEISILQQYGPEIGQLLGPNCALIEYGSGSSQKIRLLLSCLTNPVAYMPIDISREDLFADAQEMSQDYPNLDIIAICADYTKSLTLPKLDNSTIAKRVVFFPGSTIGNLNYDEALELLSITVAMLQPGDGLLIGTDLKKDPQILHAAYNDAQGVTAQFNLNLLARINRELGGNFELANFVHSAIYNEEVGGIEMYLISQIDQTVRIGDTEITFAAQEAIQTENSHKYSIAEFQALAQAAGFQPVQVWTDPAQLFSVHYLSIPG